MQTSQQILTFACAGCPFNIIGRCKGPPNNRAYLMQGRSLISCIDVRRRGKFIDDTYDRATHIPKSSHQKLIKLPPFVPGVTGGIKAIRLSADSLVAISLGDIVGTDGNLLDTNMAQIRSRFGLPPKSRVALIGTAKDSILERMWKISNTQGIWKRISQIGFEWTTSLTFSVWDEMPRADQIRNQDRNFQTHDAFSNFGLPCIPFLFPVEKEDYDSVREWLRERPDITMIAIHAQAYKRPAQIARLAKEMRAIERAGGRPIHFLVVGPATAVRIGFFMRQFSTTIVTWKPFHRGRTGSYCNRKLSYFESDLRKEELIHRNFREYHCFCNELSELRKKVA